MTQTPRLETIIEGGVEQRLSNFYTALPGKVTSFDSTKQTASVEPYTWEKVIGETGDYEEQGGWSIQDCPVLYPGSGGNGFRVTWPLKAGDSVLLIMSSLDLDRWKATGSTQHIEPNDSRNSIHNAFCIPSIHSLNGTPTTCPTDALVLHGSKVLLGGPGADVPTRQLVVQSALTTFCQALVTTITGLSGNIPGQAALAALANNLFSGGFDINNPPSSFALWSAGTTKGFSE